MANQYILHSSRWWIISWVISFTQYTWAQTTQPQNQWQRVIESNDLTGSTPIQAVQVSQGEYAVLTSKNLIRLSATGNIIWNKSLPGTRQDSLAGTVPIRQTVSIVATSDNGCAMLALDTQNRYYVVKLNAAGEVVWTRITDRAGTNSAIPLTDNVLLTAPDGSLLVVGSYSEQLTYLTLTKLNQEGAVAGQWRIRYTEADQPVRPVIRAGLSTPGGGFLLVGKSSSANASKGLALQLDAAYHLTWQQTYSNVDSLAGVVANPSSEGTYTAVGLSPGGNVRLLTISSAGKNDGNQIATFAGSTASVFIAGDKAGNSTILDATGTPNRDFRLQTINAQSAIQWTKKLGGSGNDTPTNLVATSDGGYLVVGTTTSTDGDVTGKTTTAPAVWVVKVGNTSAVTTLSLQAPTYNCQTGAIVFNTTGGDGSPITYTAPGITRANLTDNFGVVEPGLRRDPKVITIQAMQSGQAVSYAFDLAAYCQNVQMPTDSMPPLMLIAPTYNCQTGAITFHTTGGDGSLVEYAAAGITGWTTNPSQFVDVDLRTAYDAQPITIMARQHNKLATYVLDIKAVCGRARIGINEVTPGLLSVAVLGNPVRDVVSVEITGAQGQALQLRLIDGQGRLVEQRQVGQAGETERQTFDIRRQASGNLLVQTTSNGQQQTVKVVKQ